MAWDASTVAMFIGAKKSWHKLYKAGVLGVMASDISRQSKNTAFWLQEC